MSLKKIDCLKYLFTKLKCRMEILEFLKNEHLISDRHMSEILHESSINHATRIFNLLENLQKENKLQLVDYEWAFLTVEMATLTLVTNSAKKEFKYVV